MRLALEGAPAHRMARSLAMAELNSAASEMPFNLRSPRLGLPVYSCLSVKGRLRTSPLSPNFQKLHLRVAAHCQTGSRESTVLEKQEAGSAGQTCISEHRSHSITALDISPSLMMRLSEPKWPAGEAALSLISQIPCS